MKVSLIDAMDKNSVIYTGIETRGSHFKEKPHYTKSLLVIYLIPKRSIEFALLNGCKSSIKKRFFIIQ